MRQSKKTMETIEENYGKIEENHGTTEENHANHGQTNENDGKNSIDTIEKKPETSRKIDEQCE